MNVNKGTVFHQQSTNGRKHNVMQPTSPIRSYPSSASPFRYGTPGLVRPSIPHTSSSWGTAGHWGTQRSPVRAVSPVSSPFAGREDNFSRPINTVPSHSLPGSASNTVHYKGSPLTLPGGSLLPPSPQKSLIPHWSSSSVDNHQTPYAPPDSTTSAPSPVNPNLLNSKGRPIKIEEDDFTDPNLLRQRVLEFYMQSLEIVRVTYRDKLQELFFLRNGGNMVEYPSWKKRPNPHLTVFLNNSRLDDEMSVSTPTATNTVSPSIQVQAAYSAAYAAYPFLPGRHPSTDSVENKSHLVSHQERLVHSQASVNHSPRSLQQHGPSHHIVPKSEPEVKSNILKHSYTVKSSPTQYPTSSLHSTSHTHRPHSAVSSVSSYSHEYSSGQYVRQHSHLSSVYGSALGTHQDIAYQARREQDIIHRINELRKEGLWSASRLPKVHEQPRKKAHWDYLLEEMQWLATDFSQERRWKKAMARKISKSVLKFHQDKKVKERKAKKEETSRLKRIASSIAKEVKQFWIDIEKVAQYKQQSRLEEKRKKALDLHLNFIVDQTEKYSSWLVEGLKASEKGSSISSPLSSRVETADESDEFDPNEGSEDDEGTIDREENEEGMGQYDDEIEALRREGEIPIEEILENLPQEMFQKPDISESEEESMEEGTSDEDSDVLETRSGGVKKKGKQPVTKSKVKSRKLEDDEEFVAEEIVDEDDEETLLEQEKAERGKVDHKKELEELEKEGEMSLAELLEMYHSKAEEVDLTDVEENGRNDESGGDSSDNEESEEEGTEALLDRKSDSDSSDQVPDQQLNDAAATAESLQPKGFTLSTTEVKTAVPFLLRHQLREYQHIGLDWLVTMYDKQLNGILADEMGLGKTIETIALLAHLACEKGVWGPHLIVVPTSVMLNWEYEIKKWCPGFKILTYYGSQKERKKKREGWSKPNAFHICITSYKIVIQDHQSFRRRKWKYLILDEAQNIKNFKSQRWQMLLNFNSQRRLLLTGTPLQNSLMELWSLMHFLMPHLFASHQDFKEWFSNPLSGMIEGSREYNESIVKRLHKVLRPFLLRRLKSEVEMQMPKKYEHVVNCPLSKRQRYLYEEFMSRTKTKETLESGNFLSVINILMQLRKVCNHPDLFEMRPTVSAFIMEALDYYTTSLVHEVLEYQPLEQVNLNSLNLRLLDLEMNITAFGAHRTQELKVPRKLIEEIDSTDNIVYSTTNVKSSVVSSASTVSSTSTLPIVYKELPTGNISNELLQALSARVARSPSSNELSSAGHGTFVGGIPVRFAKEVSSEANDIDVVGVEEIEVDVEEENEKPPYLLESYLQDKDSPFYMSSLHYKHKLQRHRRLTSMANWNERRCEARPIYGSDLCEAVKVCQTNQRRFIGALQHQLLPCKNELLAAILQTPKERLDSLKEIIDRFVFAIPKAEACRISMHTSHCPPSVQTAKQHLEATLSTELAGPLSFLSTVQRQIRVQFPETRLIQYDCGKLQTLDILLRNLKAGKHRVLLFTQMTRMLDVLEKFLNYHGHIYLRLDGSTKIEQRQVLMERFNQDSRIFCFILSTRSGGIGVNLTGADTVIFYDTDWNPTMDAQAQDRCHRIGQTRDVHIYRLICERTIEENILKKARQKRLLGDIAIEGGNFTTAFFKQGSLKDIFQVPPTEESSSSLIEIVDEEPEVPGESEEQSKPKQKELAAFEKALYKAEDEQDVKAASLAKAEQVADLAEFDEKTTYNDKAGKEETSKVEEELALLENELKPVERYALKFVEGTAAYLVVDVPFAPEKQVELAKKDWELEHLQAIKEAEERKNAEEEDDMFFTYAKDESYDQVPTSKSSSSLPRLKIKIKNISGSDKDIRVENSIDEKTNTQKRPSERINVTDGDKSAPQPKRGRLSRKSSRSSSRSSSPSSSKIRTKSCSSSSPLQSPKDLPSPLHSPTRESGRLRRLASKE